MAFRYIAVFAFLAAASAGAIGSYESSNNYNGGYNGGNNYQSLSLGNSGYKSLGNSGSYSTGNSYQSISLGSSHGSSSLGDLGNNYGKQILIQQEQPIAYKQISQPIVYKSIAQPIAASYNSGASYKSGGASYNSGASYGGNYADDDQKYGPAHYEFNYSVKDEHTGDIKEQQEKREGDKVVGFYSLVEPDGHRRIVHYEADKHSGFNAKVDREFVGIQAPQQQIKYAQAAPAIVKYQAAPVKIISSDAGSYSSGGLSSNYGSYHH